jgi:hypothetical protein
VFNLECKIPFLKAQTTVRKFKIDGDIIIFILNYLTPGYFPPDNHSYSTTSLFNALVGSHKGASNKGRTNIDFSL